MVADWERIKQLCDKEIPLLREQIHKLEEDLTKLAEPPLQYAIYLGPSPGQRDAIVNLDRRRYEVHFDNNARVRLADLKPGQQVVLNKDMNIVDLREKRSGWGETAEVVNVIRSDQEAEVTAVFSESGTDAPVRVKVPWREGESLELDCSPELARLGVTRGWTVHVDEERGQATLAKPRLHVKVSGHEGMIVEISEGLAAQGIHVGDIVCLDVGAKLAFEKLPSYEVGNLLLEHVPNITYEDIGGLDTQIEQIYDAIDLPYLHGEIFELFQLARPKGILLYGPPGCGKTMIAKAVANSLERNILNYLNNLKTYLELYLNLQQSSEPEPAVWELYRRFIPEGREEDTRDEALRQVEWRLRVYRVERHNAREKLSEIREVTERPDGVRAFFLNVKGPELLDKYVGETEHRIRKVFEEARRKAGYYHPVVIFFDEMEAMFRTRGSGISSDVESTIVPQFLSEIDGVEKNEHIVIIGASNRQELIDPALLRPGRLDVKIRVDRPERQAAKHILALHLPPTLPLDATDLNLPMPSAMNHPGEIIFRQAYRLADDGKARDDAALPTGHFSEQQRQILQLLPPGCDMRLARSFSVQDLEELSQYANLTFGELIRQHPRDDLLWDKIRLFQATVSVKKAVEQLLRIEKQCQEDANADTDITYIIRQEWIAEAIIHATIFCLYSSSSTLQAATNDNRFSFPLMEFMSGAILANIVARAKSRAIKKMIPARSSWQPGTGIHDMQSGISIQDMLEAAEQEFKESAEYLIQQKLQTELEIPHAVVQDARVKLVRMEKDIWSEAKLPLYRQGIVPPAHHTEMRVMHVQVT